MLNVSAFEGHVWGRGFPQGRGQLHGAGPQDHRTAPQLGPWQELGVFAGEGCCCAACAPALGPAWGQAAHRATASMPFALGLGRMSCPTSTRG